MLVDSDAMKVLEDRVAQLEKRVKTAESQCQATTREIWQMENELARLEERAATAESRAEEAEAKVAELGTQAPAALDASPQDAEREQELRRELSSLQAELEALRHSSAAQVASSESSHSSALHAAENSRLEVLQELEMLRTSQSQVSEELKVAEVGREAAAQELLESRQALERLRQELVAAHDEKGPNERRVEALEFQLQGLRLEADSLREQLQKQPAASGAAADPELEGRLERMTVDLERQKEKNEVLQDKISRMQDRLEIADEKAMLLQHKMQQVEERLQNANQSNEATLLREKSLQSQLQDALAKAARFESRSGETDRVYEAAENKMREAEAKAQESWQRIRDAETRANQAAVEAKKLADRLAEFEKRSQESDRETQRLAFQDPLTGLPNNNLINQYLDFTVKQAVRYRRVAALLIVDIDNFKVFNEAMGFKAGDELLVKISERLKLAIRDTDSLGRRGEDEFLVLLSELNVVTDNVPADVRARTIRSHVEVVANRLMESFAKPFALQGQKFYLQASIGISICPDDGETPTSVMENAETAMYFAKENGRNRFQFFSTELRKQQEKRLSLDTQLRSGLDRGEFLLHFQPIIQLLQGKGQGKGTMVGVEALVRWNHRIDGLVQPEYFLPAAEESGAIVPLGNWVVRQSCHQLREWLTSGLKIFASVNLSKRQLLQADLVETVTRELREQGIAPDYFMVEIAEGFNTFNPEMMDKVVNDLGQAGVRIAIDDFGIGYSSLSRLNLTHTKIIKIDRSII